MGKYIQIPLAYTEKLNGVTCKDTDYHKQKQIEKRNPIFKTGGRK